MSPDLSSTERRWVTNSLLFCSFFSCFKRLRRLEIRSSPASSPFIDLVAACLGAVRLHLLSVLSLVPAHEPAC